MRIIITGLSVAAAAMMVIACQSVATADVTLYLNYTVGEPFQEAQEALFLGAVTDEKRIHFDDHPAGPITGHEWEQDFGVVFRQPDAAGLQLDSDEPDNPSFTPRPLSGLESPNALYPYDPVPNGSQRLEILLTESYQAVGFWLIDSEHMLAGLETIEFYDADENLLLDPVTMPITGYDTGDVDGNFFIGLVSDVLIARVLINEWHGADAEDIGLDDVWVPEPATLSLLALGGLAAMRRRR